MIRARLADRGFAAARDAACRSRAAGIRLRALACVATILGVAAAFASTHAAETQWWIVDSAADHSRSESRGVIVRPEGVLELGPRATTVAADSLSVIWAIAPLADGSVALGGDGGRIDRWVDGRIRPWVELPAGQVLSLVADGNGVVAGTGPEGLVYRIGAKGDTSLIARTGERYVWGLARGPSGSWYAATGTRGKLLRLEGRKIETPLDTDESNLVAMASDGKGGVYVAGDSKGRIIHVRANGSSRTLYDAPEDEVRALAIGADGALYAAGLSASATAQETEEGQDRPTPARSSTTGGRATVYRIVPDSITTVHWTSPHPFVFALAGTPRGVVAATGNRAGVFSIERANGASQWLAAPQGQITALAVDRSGRVFAAGSNPGALWILGPGRADRGELLSPVFDGRRMVRFGRIRWHGDPHGSRVEIETRSGNTETPDTTWSAWHGAATGHEGRRVDSPAARYLQWRVALSGGEPRIESVDVAWREQNLPPRIDEVLVAPQGQGFREGDLMPRTDPVTQTLPGGQKVEYSINPSTGPSSLRALPTWARGLRTVQWKASDPNGDPLRYRVDVRREPSGDWMKIDENLDGTAFTWDTQALPDGRYRLRIIVTDEPGNAVGEERTAEATSEPFAVDNSPPSVTALEARGEGEGIHVIARAEDAAGVLSRMEVAIDDGKWRIVSPEGGLADDRELSIRTRLPDIKPGAHTVSVRAVDLAGNAATRAVQVKVLGGR